MHLTFEVTYLVAYPLWENIDQNSTWCTSMAHTLTKIPRSKSTHIKCKFFAAQWWNNSIIIIALILVLALRFKCSCYSANRVCELQTLNSSPSCIIFEWNNLFWNFSYLSLEPSFFKKILTSSNSPHIRKFVSQL